MAGMEEEVAIIVDEDMEEEAGGFEGMTAEEEAEAARLVEAELAELGDAEVELEEAAEAEPEVIADEEGAEVELELEEPEAAVEIAVEAAAEEPVAQASPPTTAPPAFGGKGKGEGKGLGGGKGKGKGKDFGKGWGKGKDKDNSFFGLVHQVGEKTGNMLVKCWKVSERFGSEAMIPKLSNPSGAKLGDRISFEVQERPNGARPLAINVQIRGHVDLSAEAQGPPEEVRRQVLYYLSDDNLKTDKFFQDVIAQSEGGWIPMTTILGCPRMKQMKATCESVFAVVKGAPEIEIREAPAGEEAIRRTKPPPTLEEGAGRKGWKGQGKAAAAAAAGPPPKPGKDDLYYAGVVKSQQRSEPFKFFITCDEITQKFGGRDAFFLPDAKPASVEVGSMVVFSVPPTAETGFSPMANFVGALGPLGSLGKEAQEGNGVAASKGPSVQKTIVKRTPGK